MDWRFQNSELTIKIYIEMQIRNILYTTFNVDYIITKTVKNTKFFSKYCLKILEIYVLYRIIKKNLDWIRKYTMSDATSL